MSSNEPMNLQEWEPLRAPKHRGRLFTCGRPGRATFGRQRRQIGEDIVELWVNGLPRAEVFHIVSLLGHKPDGFSEFDYYPFRSSREPGTKPTFQEWLDERYPQRFVVEEFPTVDRHGIPPEVLAQAKLRVLELTKGGRTVVLLDSAGAERTARVCEAIGYRKMI